MHPKHFTLTLFARKPYVMKLQRSEHVQIYIHFYIIPFRSPFWNINILLLFLVSIWFILYVIRACDCQMQQFLTLSTRLTKLTTHILGKTKNEENLWRLLAFSLTVHGKFILYSYRNYIVIVL